MRSIAQRQDIGDRILDGVDSLLGRYGYRKMTMEDLALEVGIGKGTVYLHFASKEEVVLSHIDRIVDRLLQRLEVIRSEPSPAGERLRRMLITRVLYRFDSVGHYAQSLNDLLSALRQSFLARRQQHFRKESALFAEILEEGRSVKTFRFDDARGTADALLWATNALLPYSLSPKELGRRKGIESVVTRMADLLLNGLMANPLKK